MSNAIDAAARYLLGLSAAMGLGWLVYRSRWGAGRGSGPALPDPADVPTEHLADVVVSASEKASHVWARPIVKQALTELLGRSPSLAELQYGQAIGFLESSYGKGWGKVPKGREHIPHDVPGAMASNNWGAVHATGNQPGFAWSDTKPNKEVYAQRFRSYATPAEGAKDKLKHTFVLRQKVARAVAGPKASVWRASFAMRRGMYYGSWCDKAVARYGQSVGSVAAQRNPEASEGNMACEREAVELHAKRTFDIIRRIASALGEPVAMPLGTYEDALQWYRSQEAA